MGVLTRDRDTRRRDGRDFVFPLAAGQRVFAGGIVCFLNGHGLMAPVSSFYLGTNRGRFPCLATETVDNREGGDGEASVRVERTVVGLDYDGSITPEAIGTMVYMLDDYTVTRDDDADGDGRLAAGLLVDIRDGQAWVDLTRA